MASRKLLDNKIIDRLSVNKSNKSNEKKSSTEFNDNMLDFLGTWVETKSHSEQIVTIEKISDNKYSIDNKVFLIPANNFQVVNNLTYVTDTSKNNCISSEAYNDIRYLFNPITPLGVTEPIFPYYGEHSTFTLSKDKTELHMSTILYVNKDLLFKNLSDFPTMAAIINKDNLVGNVFISDLIKLTKQ